MCDDVIILILQQNRLRWHWHVLQKEDTDWVILNLTQQKRAFTNQKKCTTTGLVASYNIWPGNREGPFLFRRFINLSLTYSLRHQPTYLQPWDSHRAIMQETMGWQWHQLDHMVQPRSFGLVWALAATWQTQDTWICKVQFYPVTQVFMLQNFVTSHHYHGKNQKKNWSNFFWDQNIKGKNETLVVSSW